MPGTVSRNSEQEAAFNPPSRGPNRLRHVGPHAAPVGKTQSPVRSAGPRRPCLEGLLRQVERQHRDREQDRGAALASAVSPPPPTSPPAGGMDGQKVLGSSARAARTPRRPYRRCRSFRSRNSRFIPSTYLGGSSGRTISGEELQSKSHTGFALNQCAPTMRRVPDRAVSMGDEKARQGHGAATDRRRVCKAIAARLRTSSSTSSRSILRADESVPRPWKNGQVASLGRPPSILLGPGSTIFDGG